MDRVEKRMSNSTTVSGPIEIKDKSVERVALELMQIISESERVADKEKFRKPNSREYYLKLYNQCHRVVSWSGVDVKDVLQESNS